MASPVIAFITTGDTFNTWRLLTNNVINLAMKGVYTDGTVTDPNANVVIDGTITSNTITLKQDNASLTFKDDNNLYRGGLESNQLANTVVLFSPNSNNYLSFANTGSLTLTIGGNVTALVTNNFVSNAINTLETSTVDSINTLNTSVSAHIANTSNPHGVTKAQVGLGNVDNTSDVNKPVSTATQNAINTAVTSLTNSINGLQANVENLSTVIQLAVPAGAVMPFAMPTAPAGWLICNGAAVSRTTYATLFAAIGTTFGAGNGSTTFNLPQLQGEFVRGWDNGRGVDPGRAFGSAQLDQMQRITGNAGIRAATSGVASGAMSVSSTSAFTRHNGGDGGASYVFFDSAGSPGARVSSSTSGETRSRNVALLYCIKV